MKAFFRAHWKVIVAILVLVVLAMLTMNPTAAGPRSPDGPSLAARLESHVAALGAPGPGTATPAQRAAAARYVERVLEADGYRVRHRAMGDIEVTIANVDAGGKPEREFVVGATDNGSSNGNGTAAVLELARLLKDMRPSRGTALTFVFLMNGEARHTGNFIAYVGTLASSRPMQDALSAFRAGADSPAHGLAAPAYVQGVTLSGHGSGHGADHRFGDPAVMITDTAFGRYPYHQTAQEGAHEGAQDAPDKPDYAGVARVVQGLAHTIASLAGARRG